MLYVIRHGLTEWNAIKKLQGQTDIPLNEEGMTMASEACLLYKDYHFDICYCSPLVRAKETAQLLLKGRDIPIFYDDRLKEICFGEAEGIKNSKDNKDSPVWNFFHEPQNYLPPEGGESFEELFARTGDFLEKIVKPLLNQGKDVLIVGHGAMNSSIICQVRGLDVSHFWDEGIENCRLVELI